MKTSKTITMCAAAAAVMLAAGSVHAQCTALAALTANSPASGDFFGSALAGYSSNGEERLMIGVRADDTPAGGNAGSVYTFGRFANNQWGFLSQITASDGQVNDYFGTSVAVIDPRALIGAPGAGTGGAAYFFTRTGPDWEQRTKVTPASAVAGDDFGASVAVHNLWAVVGAPGRDFTSNTDGGALYFYQHQSNDTWAHMITVPGNNQFGLDDGSRLGAAVAMSEFVVVAGAPFYSQPNWPAEHGNVRVYRRTPSTPWALDAYLTSNNPGAGDQYGAAVSTDGAAIAIGAPRDDRTDAQGGALTDSGCVYIQRRGSNSWYIEAQLFAPDASAGAQFGSSVDISGERLIVGAVGGKKAYVFRRIVVGSAYQWVADETIEGPAGDTAPTSFANAVALTGETVAIGDELADSQSLTNPGAVYLRRPSAAQPDSCEGARVITAGTYTGCTLYASRDGTTTCGSPAIQGPDVWFNWTPACSGTVTIDTVGSLFDTVLSVHTGCPDDPGSATLVCNDDAVGSASLVSFDFTGGTTYLIRISGYNGAAGTFTLNVNHPAPTNDTCTTARVVTSGQHTFTNCLANTDGPIVTGCHETFQYAFHNDVWFRYTAQCTGPVTVGTCGSSALFDTVLAVYTACPTLPGAALACNDDAGAACQSNLFASALTFQATAGQQYLIRVGGFDANSYGDGALNISCATACPADWNHDNSVNSTDISAFLTTWLQSVSAPNLVADFNNDLTVNSTDISAFLTAWLQAVQQGC